MATINGTSGNDTRNGTAGADAIRGLAGNDTLNGKAGNDQVWGGTGLDKLWGEAGNDTLWGDDGDDFAYGGDGNDLIHGGNGNDTLYGDAGTDTIWGDAGNDILKGGTGISRLDGGTGNDSLYYDPTSDNISNVGNYLSSTALNGGSNYDTLNIVNNAKYTVGGVTRPAMTEVIIDEYGDDHLYFEGPNWSDPFINVGSFKNIEKITVSGAGGLDFFGSTGGGDGVNITGTSTLDYFSSSYAIDTMTGGAGNDVFYLEEGAGMDRIISETNDADSFHFDVLDGSAANITGFNGAGAPGGDRIYIDNIDGLGIDNPRQHLTITTSGGTSTLHFDDRVEVRVDKVGLVENVDYFFVL
ncbi:hypothetical protein N825_30500 [Skermanella stibiiresistens SB22]|uniref:Calcium-binding protein n=1 Tax=Skermanella stibiiresistens SB22 TaxID=1385369 RepID=W9H978_9PROT|nr:calcium-binding protein [Skermanella stibiiresistens]EWY41217.1 hypothetical protein N825_30500 [Skermanella stibiiresistens SB22]